VKYFSERSFSQLTTSVFNQLSLLLLKRMLCQSLIFWVAACSILNVFSFYSRASSFHQCTHGFNRCMERCIQLLGEAGGSSAFSSNPALLWLVSGMNRFYAFGVSLD